MTRDSQHRFGTHQAVLRACLDQTSGSVLELGCGLYSTPLLHERCAAEGRLLVSADTDEAWLKRFADMSGEGHQFLHVTPERDWNLLPYQLRPWSVVLVDQHPAAARLVSIAALMDAAEFIIVHDTETATYFYEPLLRQFRYRFDDGCDPQTTVVSNLRPFRHSPRETA
jgi:hypothetical protein